MKSMDFWARQVKNAQEIPESFETFFTSINKQSDQFPYTIFAPPEKLYRRKSNPKLLVIMSDRIYIAEKLKKQIQTTCFLFKNINYIETGTLLLHSWLAIDVTNDGEHSLVTVEFNTVVFESLFKPIVEIIRAAIHNLDQSEFDKEQLIVEQAKFNALIKTDFKFMNFGRRSLIAGEQIRKFILQPDIRVKFMKYFQRTISFTHLTILTDHELIIIKDDDSLKTTNQVRYGGIWRYIPLQKIINVNIESNLENELIKLTIILPDNVNISSLFRATQKTELELLTSGVAGFKIA